MWVSTGVTGALVIAVLMSLVEVTLAAASLVAMLVMIIFGGIVYLIQLPEHRRVCAWYGTNSVVRKAMGMVKPRSLD